MENKTLYASFVLLVIFAFVIGSFFGATFGFAEQKEAIEDPEKHLAEQSFERETSDKKMTGWISVGQSEREDGDSYRYEVIFEDIED